VKIGSHRRFAAQATRRTIVAIACGFHAETYHGYATGTNEILRDREIANDLYCFRHKAPREGNLKVQVLRRWFSCATRCYTWRHEDFYD
jgi:hypothetical protein